jgi:uncharacterized OB-fold protein
LSAKTLEGSVYTYTTVFSQGPEFAPSKRVMPMPYTIVVVEKDEGPVSGRRRLAGWVPGAAPDNGVFIGAHVVPSSDEQNDQAGVQYRLVKT